MQALVLKVVPIEAQHWGISHFVFKAWTTASRLKSKFEIPEATADAELDRGASKAQFISLIKGFRGLHKGWDSYAAGPPNEKAIRNAMDALNVLARESKFPTKVSPSADEGVIFEFLNGNNYYLLEFCNDGDIVFLKRKNGRTEAFDISSTEIEMRVGEIKVGQV